MVPDVNLTALPYDNLHVIVPGRIGYSWNASLAPLTLTFVVTEVGSKHPIGLKAELQISRRGTITRMVMAVV